MTGSRHSYGVGKNERAQETESLVLQKVSLLRRIWMHHGRAHLHKVLVSGPLRLRRQRAFLQLQACTSPRANFPTRAGPHNFGARGSSPSEGRGLAPGGHLPAPGAVRARAPAVSGCFPKVHSGEAGRVA